MRAYTVQEVVAKKAKSEQQVEKATALVEKLHASLQTAIDKKETKAADVLKKGLGKVINYQAHILHGCFQAMVKIQDIHEKASNELKEAQKLLED